MAPRTARVDVGAAMAEYLRQNPRSSAMSERASVVIPGGTTRTTAFFPPFPPTLAGGEGCRVTGIDGNRRVDSSTITHSRYYAMRIPRSSRQWRRPTVFRGGPSE